MRFIKKKLEKKLVLFWSCGLHDSEQSYNNPLMTEDRSATSTVHQDVCQCFNNSFIQLLFYADDINSARSH